MIALAFVVGMTVTVVLGALAWLVARSRTLSARVHDRVVVTLKSGESFAGLLYAYDNKAIVLRHTEALGAGERRTNLPLDGELIVLLPDVAHIQKP